MHGDLECLRQLGHSVSSVRLIGLPPLLFYAWEQHSDAMLREYVLATSPEMEFPYSEQDVTVARRARQVIAAAVRSADDPQGDANRLLDVAVDADDVVPGDFSVLQGILDHAYALGVRGDFLTLPSLPEVVGLRNWLCDQVVTQAAGGPATRWDVDQATLPEEAPLAQWPGVADLPPDGSWLVGDDQNRIVAASAPALSLLRWNAEDLIGQRIIAVVPPSLRHAHVAAFTHALVSGEHRLLGQSLLVDAWTQDGGTVPITLMLQRHNARAGRAVYVAWLTPRPQG